MKRRINIISERRHCKQALKIAAAVSLSLTAFVGGVSGKARAQSEMQSVVAASALKELPLKAWGTYNRVHLGPACLVNLLLGQQFQFPVVISQQQAAVMPQRTATLDGRFRTSLASVILQRRAMGMSPAQAKDDDKAPTGPLAALNRRAQIITADGDSLLWSCRMAFAPAALAQTYATLKNTAANGGIVGAANVGADAAANARPNAEAWGAGEATVDCFPAFAEPDGDGLLLRVTLVNRSAAPQTYCVDLLGGMDTPGPAFAPEDLLVRAAPDLTGAVVQHRRSPAVFALAAPGAPYRARSYRVSDAYFAPGGAVARLDAVGAALPNGLLAFNVASPLSDSDNPRDGKAKKEKPVSKKRGGKNGAEDTPALPEAETNAGGITPPILAGSDSSEEGQYALTRVDEIAVAPGQTVQFFLSVGVGRDADAARSSAQTLLGVSGNPDGSGQTGAYAAARKAHEAARFTAGQSALNSLDGLGSLDRLMAQSLANTPDVESRRIGVGTRTARPGHAGSLYDPARDALMAVGWTNYRPFFAAAQLNAWFQTQSNPEETSGIPVRNPRATPPTNLFALWELYERSHDRALLKRYYPYARRRYQELLIAGRAKEDAWRFAWPASASDAVFRPGSSPLAALPASINAPATPLPADVKTAPLAAPDYAAYVIRAARIMQAIAELSDQPAPEIRQYAIDALETMRVMNAELWDANLKTYAAAPSAAGSAPKGRADTLAGLLPLMGGMDAQTPEQRALLLQNLTDPATFWSPNGLRSVSLASPAYRAEEGGSGAVRFGLNWLFWKALLDLGETDTARKLASNLLQGYAKAQAASGTCPEWLNGDNGAAGGVGDYAGDACALLAMYAAYHQPGAFTAGWNVHFLDSGYNAPTDALHLVVRRLQPTGNVRVLCVMGRPNGKYTLMGAVAGMQTAADDGTLTLTLPQDTTTLVIDISPAK